MFMRFMRWDFWIICTCNYNVIYVNYEEYRFRCESLEQKDGHDILVHLIIMLLFNGMICYLVCIQCDKPWKVFNGLFILDLYVQ